MKSLYTIGLTFEGEVADMMYLEMFHHSTKEKTKREKVMY